LIVDDDPQIRSVFGKVMERDGHTVVEAENGQLGVARYQEIDFDLVLMDLVMPEQEGLESIQQIRALDPTARIIAISGGGQNLGSEYLRVARAFGALATLQKPVRPAELSAAVRQALETPR
jgi:CheY-like chemotaxis protein